MADDTNGYIDILIKDTQTGLIARVSTDSAGGEGNSDSVLPGISADGRFVTFVSYASNLVAGDINGEADIFRAENPLFLLDDDSDGIIDGVDNCPTVANADQLDTDGDQLGDACDDDDDNDGLTDIKEISLGTNPLIVDSDGDGLTDYEEVAYNGDPENYDPETEPDPNNPDSDSDGVNDGADAFPRDENEQLDTDLDGIGNNADDDDDDDGYDDVDEIAVFSDPLVKLDIPPLHAPDKPVVIEPADGLVLDAAYFFGFNAFAYIDIPKGDNLKAVQWKITDPVSLDVILDRSFDRSVADVFDMPVDITMLKSNFQYGITLKHGDSTGLWSTWSDEVLFTVTADLGEITDADGNGVEDAQQVDGYADTNGNSVDDASEGIKVINDAEMAMHAGLFTDAGVIHDLIAVTVASVYTNASMIGSVPYGLFSYKVTGLTSTELSPAVLNLTIYYTGVVPVDAQWLRFDPVTSRIKDLSQVAQFNTSSVVLTLTDGATDDLDGIVNGVIVGFGGLAEFGDDDADGVFNFEDNCVAKSNVSQCDGDNDGYGNHCDADFNNDNIVNNFDVGPFKAMLGHPPGPSGYHPRSCTTIRGGIDVALIHSDIVLPAPKIRKL